MGGEKLSQEQIKGFMILSSLIAVAGLVLMFASISIGTALGDSWLINQPDGIADTSQYNMIMETYITNFVIIGSILFAVGIVADVVIYFTSMFFRK